MSAPDVLEGLELQAARDALDALFVAEQERIAAARADAEERIKRRNELAGALADLRAEISRLTDGMATIEGEVSRAQLVGDAEALEDGQRRYRQLRDAHAEAVGRFERLGARYLETPTDARLYGEAAAVASSERRRAEDQVRELENLLRGLYAERVKEPARRALEASQQENAAALAERSA